MQASFNDNYNSPQEIVLLQIQVEQLTHTLQKRKQVTDSELESAVNQISTLGKNVLDEYSKYRELPKIQNLIGDMKKVIQQTTTLLKHTESSKSHQKIQIVFNSQITKSQTNIPSNMSLMRKQEIAFAKNLMNSLNQLNNQIHDVELYGQIVEHFTKNSSFPEKLTIYKQKFINHLFSFLLKHTSIIFTGHLTKVRYKKSKNELATVQINQQKLEKKIQDLINKKVSIKNKSFINNLIINKLEKSIRKTQTQLDELTTKYIDLSRQIRSSESYKIIGEETRANFRVLGGNNVKIALESENTTLDGTYIACDAFRKALKDGGAQKYQLSFQPSPFMMQNGHKPFELNGILFPPGVEGNVVESALRSLGAFTMNAEEPGAGWQKLRLSNGSIALITEEEGEKLKRLNLTNGNFLSFSSSWSHQIQQKELDVSQPGDGGTVILTSGGSGVYEMHKKEMLAFLIRGMNVLAFNFRGYGESTGTPTGEGLKRDMEAAYQYLKQKHQIPDEKILLKAICLGGGPAVHLASKHPKVNIFLDQSYADFGSMAKRKVGNEIDIFVKEQKLEKSAVATLKAWWAQMKRPFLQAMALIATPDWIVKKDIGKIQGHVGIMLTRDDVLIDLDQDIRRNYQAVLKGKKAQSVSVMAMEGKHGDSWLKSRSKNDFVKFTKPQNLDSLLVGVSTAHKQVLQNYFDIILYKYQYLQLTPKQLSNEVVDVIDQAPQEIKIPLREFLNKAIQFEVDVSNDPNFQQTHYEGRLQMDNFLKKSGLSGSL